MKAIGILTTIAIVIPNYADYTPRTQAIRVFGDMNYVRTVIETCLDEERMTIGDDDLDSCNFDYACSVLIVGAKDTRLTNAAACPTDTGVPQIPADDLTDTVVITATFGHSAVRELTAAGKNQLFLSRQTDGTWICSGTIPDEFKARGCL